MKILKKIEKPMKTFVKLSALTVLLLSSCTKFLEEEPASFLTTDQYYKTEEQIHAAANGTYDGLNMPFASEITLAASPVYALEYITGYSRRPRPTGGDDDQFLLLQNIQNSNGRFETWWNATYIPIENCNSFIANVSQTSVVNEETKNRFLGEVYFLRAYYYFRAVRLFGSIPLKTEPTLNLDNIQIGKSPIEEIYNQIVSDLQFAENAGLPWTDKSGRVNLAAVKSLLAEVYITMAGYPLQKGANYYQMAYDKSMEVINAGEYSLFASYADLRDPAKNNSGEHILMNQRDQKNATSIIHFHFMPYPEPSKPVSVIPNMGGSMAPTTAFYDSYAADDLRKQEKQFFFKVSNTPFIYKFWDDEAEQTSRSGANFPLMRYADVLLLGAEAKTMVDGGTTQDAAALDAYYSVHKRAFPSSKRPSSISTDDVLKERYWELCFELHTWFDMIRTRKAFDVENDRIVSLIGFKAPNHNRAFEEKDLLWLIPLAEIQANPNLK
ncbi:RagB/SusD family nutrient uptake outer membrane protein [Olivibacter ginsenosidimutans]|uniref:RagB/SusD family nutrient uptake outer membrane protein n=2 Tax=Olivibacter ginsenosidimutans TaxID=1176537 RepID=A0ABP9CDE8_9SPHI